MSAAAKVSSRTVTVGGRRISLGAGDVLGSGGEAVVFKDPGDPDSALKLYHDPKGREAKLKALIGGAIPFPTRAAAPRALVFDASGGAVIGFAMPRLNGAHQPLRESFRPSFCRTFGFTGVHRARVLREIGEDLDLIHGGGRVVGDLNGSNIMLNERRLAHVWSDVDSWQVAGFPCPVGQALYIHPSLYGLDLSQKPMFKPEHDVWSLAVVACQLMLHGVHPFKSGDHPTVGSFMERANQRLSVFDTGVSYPKVGLPPEVMTDELLHELHQILVGASRGKFPTHLFQACEQALTECPSCQTWYPAVRGRCPVCSHVSVMPVKVTALIADLIFETAGSVVSLSVTGKGVVGVAGEDGSYVFFRREAGKHGIAQRQPLGIKSTPTARVENLGDRHVVFAPDPDADNPALFVLEVAAAGVKPVKNVTTSTFAGGKAVFGCSQRFLYRIASRMIMCGEVVGSTMVERPVTQVFEGQTWFRVSRESASREAMVGFHREFELYRWFLVTGDGRQFQNVSVALSLEPRESLLRYAVHFSPDAALVVRRTKLNGIERVRADIVSLKDGSVVTSRVDNASDVPQWEGMSGCAFDGSLALLPTDGGILPELLTGPRGSVSPIAGTDAHVSADCALFRSGSGCVVATSSKVALVQPK